MSDQTPTPAPYTVRIDFLSPTNQLTYMPASQKNTEDLEELLARVFSNGAATEDSPLIPGTLSDVTVNVQSSDGNHTEPLNTYGPVIAASLHLNTTAERLTFWHWALNLNANAAKIGDDHAIASAFRAALVGVAQRLSDLGRERAEEQGEQVSAALANYVDWASYLSEEANLNVVTLANGVGVYDTTA